MRKLRYVLSLSLVLLLIAGCSKEEIQPEPLNSADDVSLKSAAASKKDCKEDHYVPFKAKFELAAYFIQFKPVEQWDDQTPWYPTGPVGGMYIDIFGSGKASHLGMTEFVIHQWWSKMYPWPGLVYPDSYGQGQVTFTAANGDLLYATYYGTADHQLDPPTEIESHGQFTGGTGRFEDVEGTFLWEGIFVKDVPTPDPANPPVGEYKMGEGTVIVSGMIKYKRAK